MSKEKEYIQGKQRNLSNHRPPPLSPTTLHAQFDDHLNLGHDHNHNLPPSSYYTNIAGPSDKKVLAERVQKLRMRKQSLIQQIHEINDEIGCILAIVQDQGNEEKYVRDRWGQPPDVTETRLPHTDFWVNRAKRLSDGSPRRMTVSAPEYFPSEQVLLELARERARKSGSKSSGPQYNKSRSR